MIPAAILSVIVQARGVMRANKSIKTVDVQLGNAEQAAVDATREVDRFGRSHGTAKLDVDARDAHRGIAAVKRDIASVSGKNVKVGVTGDTGDSTKGFDAAINKANILGRTLKLIKPAALIAMLGLGAGLFSAFAAGAVAVGSALAPLIGAFGAGAVAATAYQQALGVAKLATLGMKDVMGPLTTALARPTPAMRAFGKEITALLLPNLRHLRNVAQAGLLPGVAEGAQRAAGVFKYLSPVVAATARVMGGLAKQAGTLVGSGGFGRDIQTIGMRNAGILKIMGGAALNVVDALRHVIVVAGPLTTWMAKLVSAWAKGAAQAAATGRASGKMAAFFEQTRAVISRLLSIAGSLATAFWNVAKAGKTLGNDILASMDKGAASMARWTASASGQSKIQQFFENAKGPIYEVGRLIRDVVVGFGRLSQQPGLKSLIKQVRTDLLPVLERVINSTTKAFGPAFISMITAVAQAFEPLAGSSGPLVLYVNVLTDLANAAKWIMDNVPGAKTAITALVGAFAVSKAIGFAGSITGVTRAITAMKISYLASTGAITAETAAQTRSNLAKTVGTGAALRYAASLVAVRAAALGGMVLRGLATAFWALNAAMMANPFVLIVLGLAALGAALYLAWTKSETFRNIVTGAWNAIKSVVSAVVAWIVPAVTNAWNWIKNASTAVWSVIGGVIRTVWSVIKTVVVTTLTVIWTIITTVWNVIKAVTTTVWNAIRVVLATVWSVIKTVVTTAISVVRTVVITVWNVLRSVTTTVWNAIKTVVMAVWNALKSAATTIWNGIKTAVMTPINALSGLLGGVWEKIKGAAQTAWGIIKDKIIGPIKDGIAWIRGIVGDFFRAGESIINAVKDGIVSAAKKVYEAIKGVLKKAKDLLPGSEPKDPRSPMRGLKKTGRAMLTNIADGVPEGARVLMRTVRSQLAGVSAMPGAQLNFAGAGGPVDGPWRRPPGSPPGGGTPLVIDELILEIGGEKIDEKIDAKMTKDGETTALTFRAGKRSP